MILEPTEEHGNVSRGNAGGSSPPLVLQVIEIARKIATVRLPGVGGKPLFHRQVADKEIEIVVQWTAPATAE